MSHNSERKFAKLLRLLMLTVMICGAGVAEASTLPDPVLDQTATTQTQTIVLAGGCFWGMQAVFQHLKGVKQAISGYAGGSAQTAQYETGQLRYHGTCGIRAGDLRS